MWATPRPTLSFDQPSHAASRRLDGDDLLLPPPESPDAELGAYAHSLSLHCALAPSPTALPPLPSWPSLPPAACKSEPSTAQQQQQCVTATTSQRRRGGAQRRGDRSCRVAGSSSKDDVARRLEHRRLDANRRVRELSAVDRLQLLTHRPTHIAQFDQRHIVPCSKRRRTAAQAGTDKLSMLEEAAERMEALYELVEQLGDACAEPLYRSHARAQQLIKREADDCAEARLLTLLPDLTPRARQPRPSAVKQERVDTAHGQHVHAMLSSATERASLRSAFFLSSSLPMMTIRCDTGQVVDINRQVMAHSGWTPRDLLGKRIVPPYSHIVSRTYRTLAEIEAAEAALVRLGHERCLVPSSASDGQRVQQGLTEQYEASDEAERSLYAGEQSVVQAVWRSELWEGQLHELTITQWCEQWDDLPDGQGGTRRQPTFTVHVIHPDSIVRVG